METLNETLLIRRLTGRPELTYTKNLNPICLNNNPDTIWTLGNLDLLKQKAVALFCSVKCPGNLILKTYDLARSLRDESITVISGFHSPMEKECLDILLRGKQPVIMCPAKRIAVRGLSKKLTTAIQEGHLLMLSPFDDKVRQATVATARFRNELVAALADEIFVAYAAPGSKTEAFCKKVLTWGKKFFTLNAPENQGLFTIGVNPCSVFDLKRL